MLALEVVFSQVGNGPAVAKIIHQQFRDKSFHQTPRGVAHWQFHASNGFRIISQLHPQFCPDLHQLWVRGTDALRDDYEFEVPDEYVNDLCDAIREYNELNAWRMESVEVVNVVKEGITDWEVAVRKRMNDNLRSIFA